ncbi:MAG: trypsin-like peptidase domain-containing protein [Ferruginibacter sp.]
MKNLQITMIFLTLTTLSFCQTKQNGKVSDEVVKNLVAKNQILLTNLALFKDHKDEMIGASAFLINYKNKVFAVTAKHVLGEAMGVEPEIKVGDLKKFLISWKMFPRVKINPRLDTVIIGASTLNYDSLNKDILLLEVTNTKFNILPLNPNFNLPTKGDNLYIIGCPYSQEKCKENVYEIFYDSYDEETSMLNFIIKSKFDLSGFSGAPIVDKEGKVVSILTSGWEERKIKYVGGTFIKEIERVR